MEHPNTPADDGAKRELTRAELDELATVQLAGRYRPDRGQPLGVAAYRMAVAVVLSVPPGRLRAVTLTKLEDAYVWARWGADHDHDGDGS